MFINLRISRHHSVYTADNALKPPRISSVLFPSTQSASGFSTKEVNTNLKKRQEENKNKKDQLLVDCSLVSASKFHAVSMQTFRVQANVGNKRSPIINGHFFFFNISNSFASVHTFCIQFVLRSPVFTFWEMFQSTLYSACQSTFYNDVHSTRHNAFQSALHNVLQSSLHNVLH